MKTVAIDEPRFGEWIPVTWRCWDDEEDGVNEFGLEFVVTSRLPEEEIEILVCVEDQVWIDENCYDIDTNGYYLGSGRNWDEVDAWMPLPEPYRKVE